MSEISRRRFLAGAAAGAAASAASFAHAAAAPADLGVCKLPAKWDESYELVVIGSGGAGLATAVSASQNGVKKILVLEKMSYIGGNTAISGGGFNSYDPVRQGKQNIKDSPENHAKNTLEGGDGRANPELVNEMTKNSYDAVKWLESMGMKFKDEVYQIYGGLFPRCHAPLGSLGSDYIKVLKAQCDKLGIEIRTQSRVTRVIREEPLAGKVVGVEYQGKDGKAHFVEATKSVVAAAGGFAANPQMPRPLCQIAELRGTLARRIVVDRQSFGVEMVARGTHRESLFRERGRFAVSQGNGNSLRSCIHFSAQNQDCQQYQDDTLQDLA